MLCRFVGGNVTDATEPNGSALTREGGGILCANTSLSPAKIP